MFEVASVLWDVTVGPESQAAAALFLYSCALLCEVTRRLIQRGGFTSPINWGKIELSRIQFLSTKKSIHIQEMRRGDDEVHHFGSLPCYHNNNNNNNNNNNKLQLGCHPVAVVILHVNKT